MYKLTGDYTFQGMMPNDAHFFSTWKATQEQIREEAERTSGNDDLDNGFWKRVSWDVTTATEIKRLGVVTVATQYNKSDTKADYAYTVEWVEIEELISEWYHGCIEMAVDIWNTTHSDYDENFDENRTLLDVAGHGADMGVSGFIYYHDTIKFGKLWFDEIMEIVKEDCDSFGQNIQEFLSGFNCLDADTLNDALMTGLRHNDTVLNALAWYALEHVARAFEAQ
ncbi:hypothetical protein LCGC14_2515830 [marine sediment metagenome]|uniref:DUF7222 domain-containing protein n=1 Tax=marine sediment metagenome TaxID=412755 RepID=A0A0F9BKS4_9ZZZZ